MLARCSLLVICASLPTAPAVAAEDPGPALGLAALDRQRLMAHVEHLAGPELEGRGVAQPGNEAAVQYIEQQFRDAGLQPIDGEAGYRHEVVISTFSGEAIRIANVVGFLEGRDADLREEVLVVGAHLDHLGRDPSGSVYPGADDNASGIAVLLEVARSLAQHGPKPRRSICFAAFNGEEGNFFDRTRPRFQSLSGSQAFAEQPPLHRGRIVGMINMDMVGRYLLDEVLALPSLAIAHSPRDPFAPAVEAASRSVDLGIHRVPIGYLSWTGDDVRSDHAHFHLRGLPILWLSTSVHGDYHQPTDRIEKIRPQQLLRIARFLYLTLIHAADARPEIYAGAARRR